CLQEKAKDPPWTDKTVLFVRQSACTAGTDFFELILFFFAPLREQELGKPAHQCFFTSQARATSTSVCLLHLSVGTRSIPHVRVRPDSNGQEGHSVHSHNTRHSDHGTRRSRAP